MIKLNDTNEGENKLSKNLIVYYTREGQNYWNGGIKNIDKGNTERVAEFIQEAVGGDLFRVDTVDSYPEDYYECIEVAKDELRNNERPEIKGLVDNIDEYDTVFIGYPNWWGTMPMPMFTFIENSNLDGKNIIPFCTNEGSGLGKSVNDLKKALPKSNVKNGLSIHGAEAAESKDQVTNWAKNSIN